MNVEATISSAEALTKDAPGIGRLWEQWEAAWHQLECIEHDQARLVGEAKLLLARSALIKSRKDQLGLQKRHSALQVRIKRAERGREALTLAQAQLWNQMCEAAIPVFNGPKADKFAWLFEVFKQHMPAELLAKIREQCPNVDGWTGEAT